VYSNRKPPEEPPCETCRETPLEENEDAINVFFMVRYQLIMGMKGPLDINHQSIHEAMRLHKVERRRECFEKIVTLSRWWIDEIANKEKT
jgi:hypothetical protein